MNELGSRGKGEGGRVPDSGDPIPDTLLPGPSTRAGENGADTSYASIPDASFSPHGLPNIVVRRAQVAIEWEQVEEGLVVGGDWIGVEVKPARGGFRLEEAMHAGAEMALERLEALRRGEG